MLATDSPSRQKYKLALSNKNYLSDKFVFRSVRSRAASQLFKYYQKVNVLHQLLSKSLNSELIKKYGAGN
jgi:hypothetical protein